MIFDQQYYDQYTAADLETWSILFMRQMLVVKNLGYRHFRGNIKKLGLSAERIPEIKRTNNLLELSSGLSLYPLPELLTDSLFFRLMTFKRFGVRTSIREKSQMDNDKQLDMFSDVFGYAPLLADPVIASFIRGLGSVAERHFYKDEVMESVNRLFGFTVSCGLVTEGNETKIFGGKLLSSAQESRLALTPSMQRIPFDLNRVLITPYSKEGTQQKYFVLDSLGQLKEILKEFEYNL